MSTEGAAARKRAPAPVRVVVAGPQHFAHAGAIARAIRREVERGAIGMARRSPALLRRKMAGGEAILALAAAAPASKKRRERWAGFCYISLWEGGRFVSTSALIVPPRFRGRGIARLLKVAALRLARRRYPRARPFGLSTSPAVVKINRELGLREARYAELPRDPEFWKGCESCPFHSHLLANRGKTCHCTAMVRD